MRKYVFHPLVLLSIIHVIVSLLLFQENGVKVVDDSPRYLEYASNLKNGFYFEQHNFWYFGYTIFIFIVQLLFSSELAIVIAQNILSWIAIICIYKTSLLLFNNVKSAIATSLSYILFIEILSWNSYILSESVYCSLICISFYLLAKLHQGSTKPGTLILAVLIVIWTIFTKPTGVGLLGAIFFVALFRIRMSGNKILFYSLILFGSTAFILLVNEMLSTFLVMENYRLGEIIYNISAFSSDPTYDLLVVTVPDKMYIPSQETPPIMKILSFVLHHPVYWTKLFLAKLFYFLFHVRPYWSILHNLFSLGFLLPLYFYFIRGLKKGKYKKELIVFLLAYVCIHALSVGLTSVDWDGRFLLPILPAIFIVAANEMRVDFEKVIARSFNGRTLP